MSSNTESPTRVTTLPNGLTILTREMHSAPIATFWVWYGVGARNETPGITGISHWVEHMLFKATPKIGAGEIFRLVNKNGGTLNGFTSLDYTAYYETLPADRLDLAISIEADRMINARFDPDEVASERTVIISEKQGGENSPLTHLRETTVAAAFRIHPYRQGVIGYLSDLQALTRDDLYNHYRTYYAPNNATVVVVGDFNTEELVARIEAAFGGIPRGSTIPTVRPIEPTQEGERRVVVRRPGPLPHFLAAYHAPQADNPDVFPLMVLDAILSGAGSMGMSGGGANLGRSSRLYRALVETELSSGASSGFSLMRDPYLFSISAGLRPHVSLDEVERVIFEQVDRLRDEPVSDEEMARALKGIRAQFAYASEGVTSIAYWLGSLSKIYTHTLYDQFIGRFATVTAADVQRVARQYLAPDNRTVGHFIPTTPGSDTPGSSGMGDVAALWTPSERRWLNEPSQEQAAMTLPDDISIDDTSRSTSPLSTHTPGDAGIPTSGTPRVNFLRRVLPNGIVILGNERPESAAVVLRARLRAGSLYDTAATEGLARLTAVMLQRGTAHHTFTELNAITDALGASIGSEPSRLIVDLRVRCLVEDFVQLAGLLADVIRRPTFPQAELDKVRGQTLTGILQGDQDTRTLAERGMRKLAYPADHPYSRSTIGTKESVTSIDREALVAFHREYYRPDLLSFSVVGGVSFDDAVATIDGLFGDWAAEGLTPPFAIPPAALPTAPQRHEATLPGKSQSDITIGHPAIPRTNPDYYALELANLILGRFGLGGRLGKSVRETQGLAYSTGSSLEGGMGPGAWVARAGVSPANVERAIESIIAEVERIRSEPVAEDELADAQDYLTGSLPLGLESQDGVARVALDIEFYGLGLDYLDRYPGIIRALTREEIQAAAQLYLHPDRAVVSVAGPPKTMTEE
ncbi:MAG TPA: pitrilysin family protein [Thermomicrobiales bacterium]